MLNKLFDFYSLDYKPYITPSTKGESIEELHNRTAYALQRMIMDLDADPTGPKSVLICTHAATFIAIGRTLTGSMPPNIDAEDFYTFTCSLSKFIRRGSNRESGKIVEWQPGMDIPVIDWKGGKGVGGGWDCVINGDCSFLSAGEERGWYVFIYLFFNIHSFIRKLPTLKLLFPLIR